MANIFFFTLFVSQGIAKVLGEQFGQISKQEGISLALIKNPGSSVKPLGLKYQLMASALVLNSAQEISGDDFQEIKRLSKKPEFETMLKTQKLLVNFGDKVLGLNCSSNGFGPKRKFEVVDGSMMRLVHDD